MLPVGGSCPARSLVRRDADCEADNEVNVKESWHFVGVSRIKVTPGCFLLAGVVLPEASFAVMRTVRLIRG